jgi:hypothetical protein
MKLLATLTISLLAVAMPLTGSSIINETWSDGDRTNQDLANNSMAWFSSAGSSTVQVTTGSMTQLTGTGGRHNLAYFTESGSPVSIGVGEQLQMNFTVSFPNPGALGAGNDFRVGLFNSQGSRISTDSHGGTNTTPGNANYQEAFMPYSGYIFSGSVDDSRSISLRQRNPNSDPSGALIASTGAFSTLGNTASDHATLSPNVDYFGIFTIDRTGIDSAILSYTLSDGNSLFADITRIDETGIEFSFDTVAFVLGSNVAEGFTLSQVQISAIPEPAHYGLAIGGLAIAFLLIRRRARK